MKLTNGVILVICFLLLVLVALPRFNGNQKLVQTEPWDAKYYEAYVDYWRGNPTEVPIRPASNWRFLLPMLASMLPFAPNTSLNIINLFCLIGTVFLLNQRLKVRGVEPKNRLLAGVLFSISFPVFYYGCIGYVDAGSVFFVALAIYALLVQKKGLFAVAFLLGLCAKETSLLALPFAGMYALVQKDYKWVAWIIFLFILSFPLFAIIRAYAPISEGENRYPFWQISEQSFQYNVNRMRTWGALVLSIGLPGLLYVKKVFGLNQRAFLQPLCLASLAGLFSAFGLFVFSFVSTVADGRIVWHSIFFLLLFIFEPEKELQS